MTDSSDKNAPTLYEEFLAEREEMLRQKWLMSESVGEDVGLERALVAWARDGRTQWKKDYLKRRKHDAP